MAQTKDFREVILTLQTARLEHFRKVEYRSADPRRSFTLPEIESLKKYGAKLEIFSKKDLPDNIAAKFEKFVKENL